MNCPFCGTEETTLQKTATVKQQRMTVRHFRCKHGHEFETAEVHPTQLADHRDLLRATATIDKRIARFARDKAIAKDKRAAAAVAAEHGMTPERVRQIRAKARLREIQQSKR